MEWARPVAMARRLEDRVEAALCDRRALAAVLFAAAAWVFALRYSVTSAHASAGPDYGHYLIAQNWYALRDLTGEGPFDPPGVPLLLAALGVPLGRLGALHAAGPLAAASLVPTAFFLFAQFTPRWAALMAALTLGLWQQFTEFMMFGGVTNLFGMAASFLVFRWFFEATEKPSRGLRPTRKEVECALLLFLLLSIHHLTALVTGATLLVWAAVRVAADPERRGPFVWSCSRVFAVAAALGSVYLPYLLSLLDAEVAAGFGQPEDPRSTLAFPGLAFRDNPWLWQLFGALALAAFVRVSPRSQLFAFGVAVLAAPVVLVFTILGTHPLRAFFFETFALVGIASLWAARGEAPHLPRKLPRAALGAARAAFLALVLLAASVLSLAAPAQAERAIAQYHQYFTPGTLEALDWVAANTAPDAVIAVDRGVAADFNDQWKGMATGWWLEGWANRRAIYEANLVLLPFKSKWDDTRAANRFFAGDFGLENGLIRVADSFPNDDAALPRVLTGYLQDYHEFVGFSSPRLLSSTANASYTLDDAAQPGINAGIAGATAFLSGNYSGPGFNGERAVAFIASANTVTFTMNFTFGPGAPWDTLEVSLTYPPWVVADLTALEGGQVALEVRDREGNPIEQGTVEFGGPGLSAPARAAPYLSPGEGGTGIRFRTNGSSVHFEARIHITHFSDTAQAAHELRVWDAGQILAAERVTHLYVGTDSLANIQRFDRQAPVYVRAFANSAAIIYEVRLPP